MPKVSVILPNYNHARYLDQRIQSVLNQTYQDYEVIYIDDASTDNSNAVFAKYADDPRIRAIFNRTNSGSPFKQWNTGIRHAVGDYVWIAESDDFSDPRFLHTLVPILDDHPQLGLAYCQSYQISKEGDCFSTMHWWTDDLHRTRWRQNYINNGLDECEKYLLFKNTIPNASAVLIRKSAIERVGYADESLLLCGDWLTWIKVLLQADIAFSADILNYFRMHNASVRQNTSPDRFLYERIRIFLFLRDRVNLHNGPAEKVETTLTQLWLHSLLGAPDNSRTISNSEIYRAIKTYDPLVEFKVCRAMISHILRSLRSRLLG